MRRVAIISLTATIGPHALGHTLTAVQYGEVRSSAGTSQPARSAWRDARNVGRLIDNRARRELLGSIPYFYYRVPNITRRSRQASFLLERLGQKKRTPPDPLNGRGRNEPIHIGIPLGPADTRTFADQVLLRSRVALSGYMHRKSSGVAIRSRGMRALTKGFASRSPIRATTEFDWKDTP